MTIRIVISNLMTTPASGIPPIIRASRIWGVAAARDQPVHKGRLVQEGLPAHREFPGQEVLSDPRGLKALPGPLVLKAPQGKPVP